LPSDIASFSRIKIEAFSTPVVAASRHRSLIMVDDCYYGDMREHMLRTISASALVLYNVLSYPDP
jgi:hypothetical protein